MKFVRTEFSYCKDGFRMGEWSKDQWDHVLHDNYRYMEGCESLQGGDEGVFVMSVWSDDEV